MAVKKPKSNQEGLRKAAIIFLAMTEQNITKLFSMMQEDEITEVSRAISQLGAVDTASIDTVIEEFKSELSSTLSVVGNIETTQKMLEAALGKEKVKDIMDEICGPAGKNTWDRLTNVNEDMLTAYVKNEYPQTIALILSKVAPLTAAKVMSALPEELTFEVMMRMLKLDSVKKEVLDKIESTLKVDFISTLSKVQKRDSNEMVAEIFNNFDRASEARLMKLLEDRAPEQADNVKELMFTFEDLIKVKLADIQQLLRRVNRDKLPIALKGASPPIRQLFISSMSQRAAKILEEDIEALGPIKVKEVDESQAQIVSTLKEMVEAGEVTIIQSDDDEEYI